MVTVVAIFWALPWIISDNFCGDRLRWGLWASPLWVSNLTRSSPPSKWERRTWARTFESQPTLEKSCALTSRAAHVLTIFHTNGKWTEFSFHMTEIHICALSPLDHWQIFFFSFFAHNVKQLGSKQSGFWLVFLVPFFFFLATLRFYRFFHWVYWAQCIKDDRDSYQNLKHVLSVCVLGSGGNGPAAIQSCPFTQPLFLEGPVCLLEKNS